jgi:hypothetical protein
MQKFSYILLTHYISGTTSLVNQYGKYEKLGGGAYPDAVNALNKLGAEGWEVIGFVYGPQHQFNWTLKRTVPEL